MTTIGTRYDCTDLLDGLQRSEPIVYTQNGNRAIPARQAWQRLSPALARSGVTRMAEISQLAPGYFPVFQSSRPGLIYHSETGQNTGAQGKGLSRLQAQISCGMETIENYCLEPRNEPLIRGSYAFLRKQHVIVPPRQLDKQFQVRPTETEPFMWTHALLVGADEPVLVPAESVYFPFLPCDYETRPAFISSSNGVAAGSTYLEAVVHGLYELIERHYYALWEQGKVRVEAFLSQDLEKWSAIDGFNSDVGGEYRVEIVTLEIPGIKNLPMATCWLVRNQGPWQLGSGCAPTIEMAVHRAVSEAVQSHSVAASGTREDLTSHNKIHSKQKFPSHQTLTRRAYAKRVHDITFRDLRDEYHFLLRWLKNAGFPLVFIANLTRRGIDVQVVKTIVPGLRSMAKQKYGLRKTTGDILATRFRYRRKTS